MFIDFIGNPDVRAGSRIRLRARVTLADPLESPGCAVGARISVEVFDRVTRATRFIMTDTIKSPEPHLAGANQKLLTRRRRSWMRHDVCSASSG